MASATTFPTTSEYIAVLYLEDDDATAYLFQRALGLARTTLRVERVKDGKQALAYLKRESVYAEAPLPHLVILDINGPNKNGFEVLEAIRHDDSLRSVRAVVFSASLRPEDRDRAYRLGAQKFFTKTNNWSGFVETANEICSMFLQDSL